MVKAKAEDAEALLVLCLQKMILCLSQYSRLHAHQPRFITVMIQIPV